MANRTGKLYRVVYADSTISWRVKEGDVAQLVYDDGSDCPKFMVNGIELWIKMNQVEPLHKEAQPFDPVPWFCGALLIAYLVVEYIGGGIGI